MMKRYSSYKDSGVEWIGEIPSSWNKSKFKFVSELQTGNSLNENQKVQYESENIDDIPYVSSKDIDVNFQTVNYNNGLRIPKNNNPFKISPKGSFLMVIEGGSSGRKMVFLEQDVCFVNKLCSFQSTQNTKFQYYFVQSINYQDIFKLSMSGLIGGVSISKLRDFEIILPPLNEQQQIVSFLDNKTSLIDSLIEKTQQKIELLKEKRTSLINEVVTKGLNPNVETKDSGVEWIGEIPSHWVSTPLKRIVKIGNGSDYKHIEVEVGGYPVYGTGGVFSRCSEYLHTGPSVLLGRKGTIDNPLFVNEPFWTSDTIYYTIINESKIIPSLLFRLVHQIPFDLFSYGSTIPSMTKTDYEEMKFPLPPTSEQHQIVEYLDEQTQLIDNTVSIEEKRIKFLKEYRQSLISEVVTGKQKVVNDE